MKKCKYKFLGIRDFICTHKRLNPSSNFFEPSTLRKCGDRVGDMTFKKGCYLMLDKDWKYHHCLGISARQYKPKDGSGVPQRVVHYFDIETLEFVSTN